MFLSFCVDIKSAPLFSWQVKVPVIVVGCMLDKRGDQQPVSLEQVMSPIMQQFREIETCIECSALNHIQVGFPLFPIQCVQ